jgi:hypothetical protein
MKKALRRLDSVHQKLTDLVGPLDQVLFAQRPSEREWSVAEIVHHLCLVEERVIKDLEAVLARGPQRISFVKRLIPTSIVSSRLIRVKAPKAVNPIAPPQKAAAIENLNRARSALKQFCAAHETRVSDSWFSNIHFWEKLTA